MEANGANRGVLVICLPGSTLAEGTDTNPDGKGERPQISSFVHLPFPVKVPYRILDLENKGDPIPYERQLPIFGRELAKRGYVLPKPFGASVFSVYNEQVNTISDISVALGIGGPPPPDKPLVDLPFVTIGDTVSYTINTQLKLDAWAPPFLNVFVGKGTLNGHADLTVNIELNDFLPPPSVTPPILAVRLAFHFRLQLTGNCTP